MSNNVTKKDLIQRVCDRSASPESTLTRAQVRDVVQLFLDVITDELAAGHRIELRDFGVFEVRRRAQRIAQNPKTLEKVKIDPRYTVKFKAGRMMQESVAKNTPTLEAARTGISIESKPEPPVAETVRKERLDSRAT